MPRSFRLLQGFVADHIGIHHAFFLPALCYVYICYYGFKGSLVRPSSNHRVSL